MCGERLGKAREQCGADGGARDTRVRGAKFLSYTKVLLDNVAETENGVLI